MKTPQWFIDLKDEYPTRRNEAALVRLWRIFSKYEEETMRLAVDEYILHEKFFPKVADLKKYVDWAVEQERGTVRYNDIGQDIDGAMLEWEQRRGTLPFDSLLGTEWLDNSDAAPIEDEPELVAELAY